MSTNEVEVVKVDGLPTVIGTVETWGGALVEVTLTAGRVSFGRGHFTWFAVDLCRDSRGFARPNRGFTLDYDNFDASVSASEWAPILAALRSRGF